MKQIQLERTQVNRIVENALREDVGSGDITTNSLFDENAKCKAVIMVKENGIVAGLPVAELVFRKLDGDVVWDGKKKEGVKVKSNGILAEISGPTRAILTGERVALNFLQRLSGIATYTSKFVEAVRGLPVKILDTRKTVPGLRMLDKYAIGIGGGYNHRFGLYDGVLIKDNHVKLAGSISRAIEVVREKTSGEVKIEVETSTLDEVREALMAKADIIMLDNMSIENIKKALDLINGGALVEASGGIRLKNVRQIAETGVDFISIGALTHSPQALDMGLYMV